MKHMNEDVDKVLLERELVVSHKTDFIHFMDKPHFHDGFEIHYTLTNSTTYQIDERTFNADAGTVALFNSEEIHRVTIDRNKSYERYFILFKPTFINEMLVMAPFLLDIYKKRKKTDCFQLSSDLQVKVKSIFDEMLESVNNYGCELNQVRARIKLTELLILLNELAAEKNDSKNLIIYEDNKIIGEIINYMKCNYMNEINLNMLSELFFISKSTIIRSFKNILGMTPNQYLIYVRIMESRSFLEKGYTVRTVAEKVGYKDESSFIKKFKELQGISPKQYTLKLFEMKR